MITTMGATDQTKMTVEEYLAYDRAAEVKSEYHDGELFPSRVSEVKIRLCKRPSKRSQ